MKLVSFGRAGRVDCGALDRGGQACRIFDSHPVLGPMPAHRRLGAILAMTWDERRALAAWSATAESVPTDQVTLLPAVPLCPLYLYNHANTPTLWKRQNPALQWQMTRIPYPRIRSFTSLSGSGWRIAVPSSARVNGGAEFGVVIGRAAWRVPVERAVEHIAGIVCLNDTMTAGTHEGFVDDGSQAARANQNQGLDTLYKNADGNGCMGPWITTSEELEDLMRQRLAPPALERYRKNHLAPWLYNKMMRTRVDDELLDESHTGGYLYGAEWLIAYLSRFMGLPTGSVIGLGSAGWDGIPLNLPAGSEATVQMEVELEDVGTMALSLRRQGPHPSDASPFLDSRAAMGLTPIPAPSDRPGPALWVLQGNYPEVQECEGTPVGREMNPLQYPPASLAEARAPVVLPPHATTIWCSLQLAGVIGSRPVYRAEASRALEHVDRIVVMVAFRDASLGEAIRQPTAYESRAARFLGRCGDGFHRLGPGAPPGALGDLAGLTMSLSLDGGPRRTCRTANYLHRLEEMLAMVSRTTTLLPGDVLSLGPAGPELPITPDLRPASIAVDASWGASLTLALEDQRNPALPREETR